MKFSFLTADQGLTAPQQTPKVIGRCSSVEEDNRRLSEAQTVTKSVMLVASVVLMHSSLPKTLPQILLIFKKENNR